MDVKEYRKRYEAEIAQAVDDARPLGVTEARSILGDKGADPQARAQAIMAAPIGPDNPAEAVARLLGVLTDRDEPTVVRMAALRTLGAAAFLGPRFAAHRVDYLNALRGVAEDPAPELREHALEVLAIEKDPRAQELLTRGLTDPGKALVPPAKAIQFLAYDVHADVLPIVRGLFKEATGDVKAEALRLLASDPGSAGLFTELMSDKTQLSAIRRLSATALQALDPAAFERAARPIVADIGDFDEIRATTRAALAHGQAARATPAKRGAPMAVIKATISAVLRAVIGRLVRRSTKVR